MDGLRVAVLGVVAVGAVVDVRSRRIPNFLTFGAAVAGIGLHAWTAGCAGLLFGVSGWLLGAVLFLPMFLLRAMGAGDLKLLAAVGSFLGPIGVLWAAFFTALAGGVLALLIAVFNRYTRTAFRNLRAMLGFWQAIGIQPYPGVTLSDGSGPRLAYGLAIAAGTLAAVWFT